MEETSKQKTFSLSETISISDEDFFISDSNRLAYESIFATPLGYEPYNNILIIKGPKSSGKSFLAKLASKKRTNIQILDDINMLEEEYVFHYINNSALNKIDSIFFAEKNWSPKLKDLSSRINSIKTVYIEEPDDILIEIIIAKKFSDKSLSVTNDLITYLKTRLPRNFYEISRFVDEFDQYCLSNKKNISIKSAHDFFLIKN